MCRVLNEGIVKVVSLQPDEKEDESFTAMKVLIYIIVHIMVFTIIQPLL